MSAPHPMIVLQARAEARARLYRELEMTLSDALTPLLDYAHRSGIVDKIGPGGALAIIDKAFADAGVPITATSEQPE